ncbi:hypothetical protein [Haliangium sp.]|uniref:hypothetical protein n=1 Tax=Haliangium sp. TaxID=2663208 RepID=UPI003D0981BB
MRPGRPPRNLVLFLVLQLGASLLGCGDDSPASDAGSPDAAAGDAATSDAAPPDAAVVDAATPDAGIDATPAPPSEWPNIYSQANSDPWLAENHATIRVLRPKILALNFVNARSNDDMLALLDTIIAGFREGSRYHGYDDAEAPAALEYEVALAIDLRDETPPPDWPYNNSTLYPREDPVEGYWSFDYEQLFTEEFAAHYGVADPQDPERYLTLCELVDAGIIHELWIYGDADVPDVSAAEVLTLMPSYDEDRVRLPGELSRCAGNGCFDAEDVIPPDCTRSLRIGWVNNTRGPGCYLHSDGHGMESLANGGYIPYFSRYFRAFANLDLDTRYGLPFNSWYSCDGRPSCLSYPSSTSVTYNTPAGNGTIDEYDPVCGNVHFPPNARRHYDDVGPDTVMTTCRGFRLGQDQGADLAEPFDVSAFAEYNGPYYDCGGGFLVWWRQNMPGVDNPALDDQGQPMLNWWPFLFY